MRLTNQADQTATKVMRWKRKNSEPITSEREVVVVDENGREGWACVKWGQGGPRLQGTVYDRQGYDELTGEEITPVIDNRPQFV